MDNTETQLLFWRTLHNIPQDKKNNKNNKYIDELLLDSEYNIDVWYSICEKFTFPTQFISITQEDAEAIKLYYEQKILKLTKEKQINFKRLAAMEHKIKLASCSMGASEEGYFVRLSARSPKDSGFGSARMHQLLFHELSLLGADLLLDPTEKQNAEWNAFFEAQIKSLRSFSPSDAMQLLLDSERIYIDIKRAIELYEMTGQWNMYMAVRKWVPHSIHSEFRGFVYKKKLTALSQYFDILCYYIICIDKIQYMVYFSQLQKIDPYLKLIFDFFNKVVNIIPYDDFIIDFSVDTENNTVYMIELNPFTPFTSGCLFNWKKDLSILKGEKEFQCRLLRAPLEAIRDNTQKGGILNNLDALDDEFKAEFSDSLQLTESFLTDRLEQIQSDLRYTLNKRTKE